MFVPLREQIKPLTFRRISFLVFVLICKTHKRKVFGESNVYLSINVVGKHVKKKRKRALRIRANIKHQYAMKQDLRFHRAVPTDHRDRKVCDLADVEVVAVAEGVDERGDDDSVYPSSPCNIQQCRRADLASFEWHLSSHRRPLMESIREQNTRRKTTWIWWRTFSVADKFWIHILGLLCSQVRTRLMRWIVVRSKDGKRTTLKQILSRPRIPYFDPTERHAASTDTKRIRLARAETINQYKSSNA